MFYEYYDSYYLLFSILIPHVEIIFFFLYTNEFVPLMNKLFTGLFSGFRKFCLNFVIKFHNETSRVMYARGIHETFRDYSLVRPTNLVRGEIYTRIF